MTLDEFVNNYDGETDLCIGSAVSFIFIGSKDEYYDDIDFVNKNFIELYNKQIENRTLTLENAKKELKNNIDPNMVKSLKKKVRKYESVLKSAEKHLNSFTNLRCREVKENYIRFDGTMAVIIEGEEAGKFWFKHEYDNFYKHTSGK